MQHDFLGHTSAAQPDWAQTPCVLSQHYTTSMVSISTVHPCTRLQSKYFVRPHRACGTTRLAYDDSPIKCAPR
jgi:hypothetical protein